MILMPMPIFMHDDEDGYRANIDNEDTRYDFATGEDTLEYKIKSLDEEKSRILEALEDNKRTKEKLLAGDMLEDMESEREYRRESARKHLIGSIISVTVLGASVAGAIVSWNSMEALPLVISAVVGSAALAGSIICPSTAIERHNGYKKMTRTIEEYKEQIRLAEKKETKKVEKQEVKKQTAVKTQAQSLGVNNPLDYYEKSQCAKEKKLLVERIRVNAQNMAPYLEKQEASSMKLSRRKE